MHIKSDASTTVTTTRADRYSDTLWSGLWAGSNLDVGNDVTGTTTTRTTTSKPSTKGACVALGDSVAAGLGLPASANASAADQRCGRSTRAYSYIVARSIERPLQHYACSGATAGDLYTIQRSGSPNMPAQLDAAFANGTPGVISITAGANDVNWAGFMRNCYKFNCNTTAFTAAADARRAVLHQKLHKAFNEIQARSKGSRTPIVVVTGYYNPLSNACARNQENVTADEIRWIEDQLHKLNHTIRDTASRYNFVRYTEVSFKGHDICSNDPWIFGLSSPAAFHPNAEGQHAIAHAVVNAIRR